MRLLRILGTTVLSATLTSVAFAQAPTPRPHNVVLFVADGLRFRMVDDTTAPTMAAIAREGVSLRNSHALFPTFTTANASGMATGHQLGDTGDFSNTIYAGFAVTSAKNSDTPFLESDPALGEMDAHFSGNYLNEATILELARDQKHYSTASIGKVGPVLIFDPTERSGTETIIVDDKTGTADGIPLSQEMTDRLKAANLPLGTPLASAIAIPAKWTKTACSTPTWCSRTISLPLQRERCCPFLRNGISHSSWCSGRAIPTAPNIFRGTAAINSFRVSTVRPRLLQSVTPTTI